MPISPRPRTPADASQLVKVARRVRALDGYPVYPPNDDYERFLTRPTPLGAWVAHLDDEIAGHVALNPTTPTAVTALVRQHGIETDLGVIAQLLVDPDARRQHITDNIFERNTEEAIERGLVPILDVVATSNAAIALYRTAGWAELGTSTVDLPDGTYLTELVFLGPTHARDT